MSKLTRVVTTGADLEQRILSGVEKLYSAAKAAYGPGGGTVMIEMPYGDPLISRDGVTNLEKFYLEDPVENNAARTIIQSSKRTNRKVGDGTTAVAILAYALYREARNMMATGIHKMEVSRRLQRTATEVIKQIDSVKVPVDDKLLTHVARVSAGDQAVGQMIADVIKEIGIDGGVTVEDFAGVGIYNELVDGFYFRRGFSSINLINNATNLESRHTDVDIFITEKPMQTVADIAPLMDKLVKEAGLGKELILIGETSEEVQGFLILNRARGILNVIPIDMPVYGSMRSLALEDLALVTGGKVFPTSGTVADFDIKNLGSAKKVITNEYTTAIIGGEGASEDVQSRVANLHSQLLEADSQGTHDALQDRLSRLTGKVAIIRVGGASEVEQGEVKLRVQDAICAVQAAIRDGIVPGGGVMLANVSTEHFNHAFKVPLKVLCGNMGINQSEALWRVEASKDPWKGYDLNTYPFSYKPVNLLKVGIIDPASVVKEVVRNATSVVAKLITVNADESLLDRENKHD